jgi:hypothetical protein
VRRGLTVGSLGRTRALGFHQHADEHRPKRPILLAVDQQLGEGAGSRCAQMTDQLLVRTGEMARRQMSAPPFTSIRGAVARYLPTLSGMRLL